MTTLTQHISLETAEALRIALMLHEGGGIGEAEMLYRRILETEPENLDTLNYLGMLYHQLKRYEEAVSVLERLIRIAPDNADTYNNLGNVYQAMDDDEKAMTHFRRAIELAPDHGHAYNNLGVCLAAQNRLDEAVDVYRKALELMPQSGEFSYNLGNALRRANRLDEAIDAYFAATRATPDFIGPWQGLARTLRQAGRADEAVAVFDNLLRLKPGDPVFMYLRACCLGDSLPERAPDQYVKTIFDDAAESFDRHLSHLGYKAPSLLFEALAAHLPPPAANLDILDAGCGTGLCGPSFKPYASTLTGVDLSERMLRKAADRNVYDHLLKGELTRFLESRSADFDLVVSADTLCYFGELGPVFKATAGALRTGGLFGLTLESVDSETGLSQRLNHSGRYSHSRAYVEETLHAAGFDISTFESVILRNEGKDPVAGHLVVARKR